VCIAAGGGWGVRFHKPKRRDSVDQGVLLALRGILRADRRHKLYKGKYISEDPDRLLTKCPSQQHLKQLARC